MRFMSMVKATKESEAGQPPNPAMMAAVEKLMAETAPGVLVDMGGLLPSAAGARVRAEGGRITVVDGPFTEIKELVAGYAVLEVPSLADAVEEARRLMQAHIDVLGEGYEGECEVRPLFW